MAPSLASSNIALSIEHGRRQVGIMMNEEFATPAVSEAFMALAIGLLERAPLGRASPSAYLRAAIETRESARTAQALAGTAVRAQH
jgi:hypothetical protein